MSAYLGFEPTDEKEYYFVSYNNEDADRVGAVLKLICGSIPIWYDDGIEYGDIWEETISLHLVKCRSVILFLTKGIFLKKESYVQKEFRMAKMQEKDILIVFLDRIGKKDIPPSKVAFWDDLTQRQNIEAYKMRDTKAVANEIITALKGSDRVEIPASEDDSTENSDGGSDSRVLSEPSELEPVIDIKVIPPHNTGLLSTGYTAAEKKEIRAEGVKLLKNYYDSLSELVGKNTVNGIEAYRSAKSAMIIIRDQLGAYNIWKYDEDQAMNLFKKSYDANLKDIRNYVLNHGSTLPQEKQNSIRQIMRGLDDVIRKLEK